MENKTPRDHIDYVQMCKTLEKKVREDIRKHNLDEIRETIEAAQNLKKVRRIGHTLSMQTPVDNTPRQTGQDIQEQAKIKARIE